MRTFLALAVAALMPTSLAAQGWIEPSPGQTDFGVAKVRTTVSVRVSGRIAQVEVEEWFRNSGSRLGEGDYLYPLPGEATFANFSLFQGDRELRGETMDAGEARTIYEEIVRRKKDPALIELVGHGLIRARVFPINSGETRKITLRYTQLLERAGDALQFRYAAGGRYGPGQGEGAVGPQRLPDGVPLGFTLSTDSATSFRDPFSPTHQMRVTREGPRLVVRPADNLTGDLVLFLPLARPVVGLTIATHRPAGEDGYFMLTLSPGQANGGSLPRDLAVVLDVSGSMSGSKLEQARSALRQLLNSLAPDDRFRLLSFSNRVSSLDADWSRANERDLARARQWVDNLTADGGTNLEGALREAFRLESPEGRLPIVVFLTDGLPSVGERNPERLAQQADQARKNARVFAFGVGYDVNTYLLDRLSAAGRGATQYVQPGEDVERALGVLATKIRHPVLTDLALTSTPVELREVYPGELPDLFLGEDLVVFGRYRAARRRSADVTITGRRNGRVERFATSATFPEHSTANEFIPRLWAARKLGELTREIRLNGPNAELEREIREIALRYGLLSEYTSYLVQEPDLAVLAGGVASESRALAPRSAPPTPAPAQAFGAGAVAQAEASRGRREAKSQADLMEVDRDLLDRGHSPQSRHVAGRLFSDNRGVWTDLRHADSLPVVAIAPFSRAYFDLLQAAPELKPYLEAFDRVLIAGHAISIRIAPDGASQLSSAELDRMVRAFRGRQTGRP